MRLCFLKAPGKVSSASLFLLCSSLFHFSTSSLDFTNKSLFSMNQMLTSTANRVKSIKFLYSYGGRIVVRRTDGKLRYVGGYTRVLSVDPSTSYAELMVKFGESCGSSMDLKCKLPSEDLDVLISVKCDEDLRSVIEEYERASPEAKIIAVLFPIKSERKVSPPSSPLSCFDFPSPPKPRRAVTPAACCYSSPPRAAVHSCISPVVGYPIPTGKNRCCQATSVRQFHHLPHRNRCH